MGADKAGDARSRFASWVSLHLAFTPINQNQILVPVQVIEYLTTATDYIFVEAMVFYHGFL